LRLELIQEKNVDRISTFLWFNQEAEEAVKFYISIFKNSKIKEIARRPEGVPGQTGSVMVVYFELDGRDFVALNGGPTFKFTEAISLMVHCDTQEEIDYYWDQLSAGGQEVQCGWLKDKYGLSWQVVPKAIGKLLADPVKGKRVMAEVMKMVKLDLRKLEEAAK
jgi:predicted 3-demethylubiquinone-9 3-methyltransferase (glyoxalase superfamily)